MPSIIDCCYFSTEREGFIEVFQPDPNFSSSWLYLSVINMAPVYEKTHVIFFKIFALSGYTCFPSFLRK